VYFVHRGHSIASVRWTQSTASRVRAAVSWLRCELQEQTRFISAACCPGDQERSSSIHQWWDCSLSGEERL